VRAVKLALSDLTVGSNSGLSGKHLCHRKGNGVIDFLKLAAVITKAQELVHIGVAGSAGESKSSLQQGSSGLYAVFEWMVLHDGKAASDQMTKKACEEVLLFTIDPERSIETKFIAQEFHS
jgi:hypothetical protein